MRNSRVIRVDPTAHKTALPAAQAFEDADPYCGWSPSWNESNDPDVSNDWYDLNVFSDLEHSNIYLYTNRKHNIYIYMYICIYTYTLSSNIKYIFIYTDYIYIYIFESSIQVDHTVQFGASIQLITPHRKTL